MLYDILEGDTWLQSLRDQGFNDEEQDILREALDFKLCRNPHLNPHTSEEPITVYFDFFKAFNGKYYMVFYRIEGTRVILEKLALDQSQDF